METATQTAKPETQVKLLDPIRLPLDIEYAPERPEQASAEPGWTLPIGTRDFLTLSYLTTPQVAERFYVRIFGYAVEVPPDPVAERSAARLEYPPGPLAEPRTPLDEFIEAAYLFGGWVRIDNFIWQLRWLEWAMKDAAVCARMLTDDPPREEQVGMMMGGGVGWYMPHYLRNRQDIVALLPTQPPGGWALALVHYLRDGTDAGRDLAPNRFRSLAVAARIANARVAIEHKAQALRRRVLREALAIEAAAQREGTRRMDASLEFITSEGLRLLGTMEGETFDKWADNLVPRIVPNEACNDLFGMIFDIGKNAEAVADADAALNYEILGQAAKAVPKAAVEGLKAGPLSTAVAVSTWLADLYVIQQSPPVVKLRDELAARQAELAAVLVPIVARYPVILRFSTADIWDAAASTPYNLAIRVYHILKKAFDAATSMHERLVRRQPIENNPILRRDGPPETAWASGYKGSVWEYRKIVTAAVASLFLTPEKLGAAVAREMMQAVEYAKGADEATAKAKGLIEVGLPLAVGAVCPPAGAALNLAFAVADSVIEYDVYTTREAEYFCTIDPRDSFAEVDPSVLPLVMALAGAVMSVD